MRRDHSARSGCVTQFQQNGINNHTDESLSAADLFFGFVGQEDTLCPGSHPQIRDEKASERLGRMLSPTSSLSYSRRVLRKTRISAARAGPVPHLSLRLRHATLLALAVFSPFEVAGQTRSRAWMMREIAARHSGRKFISRHLCLFVSFTTALDVIP